MYIDPGGSSPGPHCGYQVRSLPTTKAGYVSKAIRGVTAFGNAAARFEEGHIGSLIGVYSTIRPVERLAERKATQGWDSLMYNTKGAQASIHAQNFLLPLAFGNEPLDHLYSWYEIQEWLHRGLHSVEVNITAAYTQRTWNAALNIYKTLSPSSDAASWLKYSDRICILGDWILLKCAGCREEQYGVNRRHETNESKGRHERDRKRVII